MKFVSFVGKDNVDVDVDVDVDWMLSKDGWMN